MSSSSPLNHDFPGLNPIRSPFSHIFLIFCGFSSAGARALPPADHAKPRTPHSAVHCPNTCAVKKAQGAASLAASVNGKWHFSFGSYGVTFYIWDDLMVI
jgi:hypothetical protein